MDGFQQVSGDTDGRDQGWHLDRRVPIALILSIMASIGGGVWWVGQLSTRVDEVTRRTAILEAHQQDAQNVAVRVDSRLARIEAQLEILLSRLDIRK